MNIDPNEKPDEATEANLGLDESFNDDEANRTRLEEIAAEEGESVEEHDHTSDADAERKADDIIDDGLIWM